MKRQHAVGVAVGVAIMLAGSLCGAGEDMRSQEPGQAGMSGDAEKIAKTMPVTPLLFRATDLIDKPCKDLLGTTRGKIEDIVLTEDHLNVAYVALALEDAPEKFYQVPLCDIGLAPQGDAVVLNLTAERIADLPSFARDMLPTGHDQRTLGSMIGMELRDGSGATICRIRDVLLDAETESIDEATVGLGGMLGLGEKLASLDWNQITFLEQDQFARTDVAADELKSRSYGESDYWQRVGFGGERDKMMDAEPPAEPADTRHDAPAELLQHETY